MEKVNVTLKKGIKESYLPALDKGTITAPSQQYATQN
jgi:hypothetical protein